MKEENKKTKKKKKFYESRIFTVAMLSLFVMGLVTAGIATYYSQKQINIEVESPVVLQGDLIEEVSLIAGDGYNIYLVEGENKLDRDVDVEFQFSLLKDGVELVDTEGFYLAYSDDIQYAYSEEYGNVTDWAEAQTWMDANLDWFDWYLTGELEDYDASVITNHGGNSAHSILDFNTGIPVSLSSGKFYAVVYFDVDKAVIPGSYTLSVDMMPTA